MVILLFMCAFAVAHAQNLQVNTSQGVVQGARAGDGDYYTFYGIHYAGSTSGANRFKGPTPAPTYPGVFHAVESNVFCAQPSERGFIGQEDCLTLNIFTRNATTAQPVVVWLTGEDYTYTDNSLRSFRSIVQEGIVVVQVNYRLSVFGFLCLGVTEAPGNAGLRDVVQALKWIQENIAGFGGNPNNVVLFGHGSGAAMVDLITLSPSANNLVHKAVALSGSGLAPWAVAYDPIGYANAVGNKLGYSGKTPQELARLFVTTDATLLVNALRELELYNNSLPFAPCVENPNLNPNDTFLADAPINILRSGIYNRVPYLTGYTDREGTIRAEQAAFRHWLDKMEANFSDFLQVDLDFGKNKTAVTRDIRDFYFENRTINMETIEDFLDYAGDTTILVPVIRGAVERAANNGVAPVRLFEFAYRGTQNSDWGFTTIPLLGARHGSILNYLLDYDLRPITDDPIKATVIRRFVAFFNNGDPGPALNTNEVWQGVTANQTNYLLISGGESPVGGAALFNEAVRVNPNQQEMNKWNELYAKYYKAPSDRSSGFKVSSMVTLVAIVQLFVFWF